MSLPGVSELLKQSIGFYKKNYKILIGLGLLPTVFAIANSLIFTAQGYSIIFILLSGIISFCAFIISIVFPIATIKTIFEIDKGQNVSDIKDVYKFAFSLLLSSLWIMILTTVIVMGGTLLFVIPGIVLAVTLSFSSISLIVDDSRGLKALLTSYYYSRPKTGGIFWRLTCIAFITMIASLVIFLIYVLIAGVFQGSMNPLVIIHSISQPNSVILLLLNQIQVFITNCVFYPILGIYSYLIYKNLKLQKAAPNPDVDFKKPKTWFKVFSIISIVIMIVSIVIIPILIISTQISKLKNSNGNFTQSVQEDITEEVNDVR